jgi:transcriptional regulator with PAS, ATPase and Fis domain
LKKKKISKKLMKKSVNISEETMRSFLEYEWPGNVRELENIIELMVNTESIPDSFMKTDGNGAENASIN